MQFWLMLQVSGDFLAYYSFNGKQVPLLRALSLSFIPRGSGGGGTSSAPSSTTTDRAGWRKRRKCVGDSAYVPTALEEDEATDTTVAAASTEAPIAEKSSFDRCSSPESSLTQAHEPSLRPASRAASVDAESYDGSVDFADPFLGQADEAPEAPEAPESGESSEDSDSDSSSSSDSDAEDSSSDELTAEITGPRSKSRK